MNAGNEGEESTMKTINTIAYSITIVLVYAVIMFYFAGKQLWAEVGIPDDAPIKQPGIGKKIWRDMWWVIPAVLFILFSSKFIEMAAAGGGVPIGATEGTQLLNNVELAAQVQQQIRTYQNLADQLDLMANNDRLLNSHNFHATGGRMLAELHRAVERDGLISYVGSSVNEEYDRVHPSYRDYARETYGIEAVTHASFRTFDEQRRANIKAALDTVNINRNQVLTEGQMLDLIQRQARDTESRKAIMQIGNDLALTQVHQARRMENLLQTQIVMQANFQAAEQSKETREQAESDDAWERVREGRKRLQQQYQERARNQP